MDGDLRESTKRREGWCGMVAGGERLSKGSVELPLHASGFKKGILQGVYNRQVVRAQIKCDEVSRPVVPRATASGNSLMCGIPGWGEVVRVGPLGGGFPKT